METLKLTSCQAEKADEACSAIAAYLGQRLGIPTKFMGDISWQERLRLLDDGQIQVGWICGLPYIQRVDISSPRIELLAAPVIQGVRYQQRPVYFSDVAVHRDSRFKTFADLRGVSWAYNEPGSQSGYNVVRYHLATLGETSGYFGRVVEAGAHHTSLQMILQRQIDASAIDSTVLELEIRSDPEIASQIRIIETLGPSPIPPWIISKEVPLELRSALRALLLDMHQDPQGRAILDQGLIDCFVGVEDRDYDPIRMMTKLAERVTL